MPEKFIGDPARLLVESRHNPQDPLRNAADLAGQAADRADQISGGGVIKRGEEARSLQPPVPLRVQEVGFFTNRPDIVNSIRNVWGRRVNDKTPNPDEEILTLVRNTVDALVDQRAVISANPSEMTYVGLIKELGVPNIHSQAVINAFVTRLAHYMADGVYIDDPVQNPDRLTSQDLAWLQANADFFASRGIREQGEPNPQDLYRSYFQGRARVVPNELEGLDSGEVGYRNDPAMSRAEVLGEGSAVETEDETTRRLREIDSAISMRFVFGKLRDRVVLHGQEVQKAGTNLEGLDDYHTLPDIDESRFDHTGQIFTANELFRTVIPHPEAYPEFQELVQTPALAYYADPRRPDVAKVGLIYPVDGNDGRGSRPYLTMFVGLTIPTGQLNGLIGIVKKDPSRVEEFYQIATDGLDKSVQRRKAPRVALMDLARFMPLDKFPGARGIDALAERVMSYGETDKLDINGITWLDNPDRSSERESVPQRGSGGEVRELNSNGEVWPKDEPVVRWRRGFRRRDLAEQHVAVMWGNSAHDGTNVNSFSSPFPAAEPDGGPYPNRERLSGFREAMVTVMDDIIDARIDFNSEIGQIIIKHVSALAPEGRQAFWWCLSSRIGYMLGRDTAIQAPAGLPVTRGTFSNPEGMHAEDWGWVVQTGRFIESSADMTGGLHRPDGQRVTLASDAEDRPMIEDVAVPIEEIRADYINGRDRVRERVGINLEIFRKLNESGERIGSSFITDYHDTARGNDRNLERRVSSLILPGGEALPDSERILSFRELAGQFVSGQFTPAMLRECNLGTVFTSDVLIAVQDEMFRIVWDNNRRLQHGGDPYPFYPGDATDMGRMVRITGDTLPEYREWMEAIVSSPQYEAWLGTNPPDLRHSNNYPNREPYSGWLSAQRRRFGPDTNLFVPRVGIPQPRQRMEEIPALIEQSDSLEPTFVGSLVNQLQLFHDPGDRSRGAQADLEHTRREVPIEIQAVFKNGRLNTENIDRLMGFFDGVNQASEVIRALSSDEREDLGYDIVGSIRETIEANPWRARSMANLIPLLFPDWISRNPGEGDPEYAILRAFRTVGRLDVEFGAPETGTQAYESIVSGFENGQLSLGGIGEGSPKLMEFFGGVAEVGETISRLPDERIDEIEERVINEMRDSITSDKERARFFGNLAIFLGLDLSTTDERRAAFYKVRNLQ